MAQPDVDDDKSTVGQHMRCRQSMKVVMKVWVTCEACWYEYSRRQTQTATPSVSCFTHYSFFRCFGALSWPN